MLVISLVAFTALYGVLAVIEVRLMVKYAKAGPPSEDDVNPPPEPTDDDSDADRPIAFAY